MVALIATGNGPPPSNLVKAGTGSRQPMKGRPDRNFLSKNSPTKENAETKTSSFADTSTRFGKSNAAEAPPPGTYDVRPQWKASGCVPLFSGPKERIPKTHSTSGDVGPAQYNVKSTFGKRSQNRKDILVSTSTRFGLSKTNDVPGAGHYYPEYSQGSLIRPTFNIAIAEASRSF